MDFLVVLVVSSRGSDLGTVVTNLDITTIHLYYFKNDSSYIEALPYSKEAYSIAVVTVRTRGRAVIHTEEANLEAPTNWEEVVGTLPS